MTKHPGEALVEVLHMGAVVFFGVAAAFQKVGLVDRVSHRCKQVRLESVGLGVVVTMTNPVAVLLPPRLVNLNI